MESDRVVSANDRNLAILISVTALGSIGIYFATRNSGFFSTSVVPVDSAAAVDSTLHGADWNGALPIAIASGFPGVRITVTGLVVLWLPALIMRYFGKDSDANP